MPTLTALLMPEAKPVEGVVAARLGPGRYHIEVKGGVVSGRCRPDVEYSPGDHVSLLMDDVQTLIAGRSPDKATGRVEVRVDG